MTTYKLSNDLQKNLSCIIRNDGLCIPLNPENTDYQEYLKWVEAGNTPLPADE